MDPIATLEIINDHDAMAIDRRGAIYDLGDWIALGGCVPFDAPTINLDDWMDDKIRHHASAINVAIVNSDSSALEGLGYKVN